MKNVRAYLFDLDGTLVDSEPLWVQAVASSLREREIVLSAVQLDALVYGRSWWDIYADLVRDFPDRCGTRDEIEARIEVHFAGLRQGTGMGIEGSISLLRRLSRHWPVAVVSGSGRRMVSAFIGELGLSAAVQFFLGCEDYPIGKPDPACYLLAAERLGIEPAACVVFEDSRAGVLAAKAAGMRCVGLAIPGKSTQDLSAADCVLADLAGYEPESPV
jgi:sugar-phosphatase